MISTTNIQVETVAAELHELWRAPRLLEDGTFEPRLKDDGVGGTVDIANTEYRDLPATWQAENLDAGHAAVESVQMHGDDIEAAAAHVHVKWMERNGSWAPAEQMVDYDQLPEDEKEKDRVHVRLALASVR